MNTYVGIISRMTKNLIKEHRIMSLFGTTTYVRILIMEGYHPRELDSDSKLTTGVTILLDHYKE